MGSSLLFFIFLGVVGRKCRSTGKSLVLFFIAGLRYCPVLGLKSVRGFMGSNRTVSPQPSSTFDFDAYPL